MKIIKFIGFILASITLTGAAVFYFLPLKGSIPVLSYHFVVPASQVGSTSLDVSVEHFEQQMWFLRKFGFRPISIDEYYLIKSGRIKPRGKEVLITFDDGNETYIQFALPIMEKYKIHSINFLVWDFLLKNKNGSMSLEGAKRYAANSLISFGSHSMTHAVLTEIPLDQAKNELVQSKMNLENEFRKPFSYFAYPTGVFNEDIAKSAQDAGYLMAFTTARKRLKGKKETFFTVPRVKVLPKDNLFVFWSYVSGIYDFGKSVDLYFHHLTVNKPDDTLKAYNLALKAT